MAMTDAERQARYRKKLKADERVRREFVLSPQALQQLDRLARHWEVSVTAAVERAVAEAERVVTADLSRKARDAYFGR